MRIVAFYHQFFNGLKRVMNNYSKKEESDEGGPLSYIAAVITVAQTCNIKCSRPRNDLVKK